VKRQGYGGSVEAWKDDYWKSFLDDLVHQMRMWDISRSASIHLPACPRALEAAITTASHTLLGARNDVP
jgi:hypothetical protein